MENLFKEKSKQFLKTFLDIHKSYAFLTKSKSEAERIGYSDGLKANQSLRRQPEKKGSGYPKKLYRVKVSKGNESSWLSSSSGDTGTERFINVVTSCRRYCRGVSVTAEADAAFLIKRSHQTYPKGDHLPVMAMPPVVVAIVLRVSGHPENPSKRNTSRALEDKRKGNKGERSPPGFLAKQRQEILATLLSGLGHCSLHCFSSRADDGPRTKSFSATPRRALEIGKKLYFPSTGDIPSSSSMPRITTLSEEDKEEAFHNQLLLEKGVEGERKWVGR
ncbi:hypothetical protein V1478_008236 [Vespula squamosa]|uniref:Uncharacterized protein n=1 Tax=Vespula squamosa TaxID=30214 RepID=A0ABD2AY88_VESSQ